MNQALTEHDKPEYRKARVPRLVSIDALRAVAALAVLFVHIPWFAFGGWRDNPWLIPSLIQRYGYLGVPLFIILSGFCIHLRIAQNPPRETGEPVNWRRFWLRRFLRLYPPYLAAIVFSLVLAHGVHGKYLVAEASGTMDLIYHLIMVHNLSDRFSMTLGNGAFWSLGTEEQLYLLYMLVAGLVLRGRWRLLLILGATTTVAVRLFDTFCPSFRGGPDAFPLALAQMPFMYWFHWIMGATAAEFACGNIRLPKWSRSISVCAGLLVLGFLLNPLFFGFLENVRVLQTLGITSLFTHWFGQAEWATGGARHLSEMVFAVSFFVSVNWCVRTEQGGGFRSVAARRMAWLGGMSYSLYLTHVPVICVCEVFLPFGWTPADWPLRMGTYSVISVVVAYVFFLVAERPCLKLLARF